jgi:hypothetical protein
MSTKNVIKLGSKFESKYLIKNATAAETVMQDIKNHFPELMEQMYDDNVSVNIGLGYETGIGTWFKGAKIEIKQLIFSDTATEELKAKYSNIFSTQVLKFVNNSGLKYEGGPWQFILP